MTTFVVDKRAVLLVPSPSAASAYGLKHPYVIVTSPCDLSNYPAQSVMMVSLSSIKDGVKFDDTCVLEAGCHAAITKRSAVQYGKWSVNQVSHISGCVSAGTFIAYPPLSEALTACITAGIFKSQFTPPWVKVAYSEAISK